MQKKLKVVTIGGGSSYTPELLEGFLKRYHELPVSELWLVDVEEGQEKLNIIFDLCKRMVEKAGVPLTVHKTLDRRLALKDADFVTTQLRVGQLKARELDERIPLSHGYLGQETNGAGGLFKGLRTIPVIFDIVKDVQEICPNAWVINFTNPAGMVTEAVYRHTGFKRFIGVCNIPIGMKMFIRDVLALTAARALLPTDCPTMMESAVLYICWSRLPKISGMENRSSCFHIVPSIIRFVLAASASRSASCLISVCIVCPSADGFCRKRQLPANKV